MAWYQKKNYNICRLDMSNFFPTYQFKNANSANLSIRSKQSLHVKISDNPDDLIKYLSFRLFQGHTLHTCTAY